jgi:hypothetical protein
MALERDEVKWPSNQIVYLDQEPVLWQKAGDDMIHALDEKDNVWEVIDQ